MDLFEINEAFAIVALIAMRELSILHADLNVNGGACALGHPVGASGARILVTLLEAQIRRGGKRGVVDVCPGGGEATRWRWSSYSATVALLTSERSSHP